MPYKKQYFRKTINVLWKRKNKADFLEAWYFRDF